MTILNPIQKINKDYLLIKLFQGFALGLLANSIVIPHLTSVNYHPLSIEIISFFTVIFLFFFLSGFIFNWSIYILISAFLTYWLLDSLFLKNIFFDETLILLIFVFAKFWTLEKKLLPKITIIFSIIFIFLSLLDFKKNILIDENVNYKENSNHKPNFSYLHIVLDEQPSLKYIPDQYKDEAFDKLFVNDYVSNNFKIYNKTWTWYHRTKQTLSSLFTLHPKEDKMITKYNFVTTNSRFSTSVDKNLFSQKLYKNGFKVSFIQSDLVEICDKLSSYKCETHTRGSNMQVLQKFDIDFKERIKIALLNFHQYYYHKGKEVVLYRKIIDIIRPENPGYYGFYSRPLTNLTILDEVFNRVKNIEEGEALFAHVLLPHYPYVLDQDCNLKNSNDWTYPLRHKMNDAKSAYEGLYDQMKCTQKKMRSILVEADKNDNLITFIHGDHGVRIFRGTEFSNNIDNQTTIVAVKDKFTEPGYVDDEVDLQTIFINFINRNFTK